MDPPGSSNAPERSHAITTVDGWSQKLQVDIQSDTANMADVFFGATAVEMHYVQQAGEAMVSKQDPAALVAQGQLPSLHACLVAAKQQTTPSQFADPSLFCVQPQSQAPQWLSPCLGWGGSKSCSSRWCTGQPLWTLASRCWTSSSALPSSAKLSSGWSLLMAAKQISQWLWRWSSCGEAGVQDAKLTG
ncbi:hypothetical protein HaLaN_22697 [Haematococcus lacustris]|uniref:Uncharacterized protein n=1 Tax=Haematococcus lacustris TaxID=44745 RepID=A0A6A0A0K9_HAELA|nr:hypothetical protein HaLaN_22697 [Haematococcus lacustris]